MTKAKKKLVSILESLPLMFAGEQDGAVTIPFDSFQLSTDEDFLATIEADEREKKFLYAYTDSGVSNNKRNWTEAIVESLGEQVLSKLPVGYLGHIKPTDYGFDFPEPQVVWFGKYTEKLADGTGTRLWIKGYLLPTAEKLETWINTKAVDSISVYAKISYYDNNGVTEITSADLKSIDISRKLGEGLNSKIVGLFGEMDATYDDVRDQVRSIIKERIEEGVNPISYGTYPNVEVRKPYVYVWLRQMFINSNDFVVEVEIDNKTSLYKASYTLSDDGFVTGVSDLTEVVEKKEYVEKASGSTITIGNKNTAQASAGEMEGDSMERKDVIASLTLDELKSANPSLFQTVKTAIGTEMENTEKQQQLEANAGEMQKVVAIIGGGADKAQALKDAIGKLCSIVGEQEGATVEAVVEKAQAVVEENTALKETVNKIDVAVANVEGETTEAKVVALVEEKQVQERQTWIEEVNTAFNTKLEALNADAELGENAQVIAQFVKDDFQAILDVKPDGISEVDWKANSLAFIEANFQASVDKYKERLTPVFQKGKAVGEMYAYDNLGTNFAGEQNADGDTVVDDDVAEAKRLGYL